MGTELRISFRVPNGPLADKVKRYLQRGMTLSDIVRYALALMPEFTPVEPQQMPSNTLSDNESKVKVEALKELQNW